MNGAISFNGTNQRFTIANSNELNTESMDLIKAKKTAEYLDRESRKENVLSYGIMVM